LTIPRQTPIGDQGVRPPRAFVVVQDIDDPCVWESASRPWELLAAPVGGRPFCNRKQALVTPNWLIYRESFLGRVDVQGLSPDGMLGFTVPIRVGGRSHYRGATLHEEGIPATLPGVVDARMDAGQDHGRLWLHATRRALLAGERGGPTVTEIAMTFGFYQLGRFATEYRTLFGELPSTTLSRHGVYTGAKPFV